jgi:hypothetical protein
MSVLFKVIQRLNPLNRGATPKYYYAEGRRETKMIMYKKMVLIAVTAIFAGVMITGCGGSKKVSQSPVDTPVYPLISCMEDAFDKPGEYMGGLGVVKDRPDRTMAILDARRAAILDIATHYIDVMKNTIEDYSKDVNVPSDKKMYESSLVGGATAVGSKVIGKYVNVICSVVSQSATDDWVGYVAVRVLLKDAKQGLADELDALKVDYDKEKFFDKMDVEFAASEEKRKKELERNAGKR